MGNWYYCLFLFSVLLSSLSQVVLKKSANKKYKSTVAEYLNPYVIGAYSVFVAATVLTALAYRGVPLSMGPVLEATGYIYIAILSVLVLKEKLSPRKILGNVFIIVGVLIYAFL